MKSLSQAHLRFIKESDIAWFSS